MALLWIEGFEDYGTSTSTDIVPLLQRRYPTVDMSGGSPTTVNLSTGRFGGFTCKRIPAIYGYLYTPALTTNDTLVVGMGVYTGYSGSNSVIALYDGTTQGVNISLNTQSLGVHVYRGGTSLGSGYGVEIRQNNWYWVEIKVKCHNTSGTVEVRVNGATVVSLSGVDTQEGTHAYHDVVRLGFRDVAFIDDVYICDGSGTANNDFLGNCRVVSLLPDGDAATLEWTPSTAGAHYGLVDESFPNDDTDYVEDATSGHVDLYDYGAVPTLGPIRGVQVNTECRNTDANSFSLITVAKSGTIVSEDSAQVIGTQSYTCRRRTLETDPNTGDSWTADGLNAAQFGVKVS